MPAARVILLFLQTDLYPLDPTNRIAVALGLDNTVATLDELHRLGDSIGMAEIRLDLMLEFDLDRLIANAPCPLIVTCRPPREGGCFRGTESERLEILARASALGCAFIDIEWDCVSTFLNRGSSTRIIVSRHFYDSMPADLQLLYSAMRDQADVVKLVGFANQVSDSISMVELIVKADSPVIAIAMGSAGMMTRLMAPCFDACLLTYASSAPTTGTAPGQITVREMIDRFGVDRVSTDTGIEVHLYTEPAQEPAVRAICRGTGGHLHVPAQVDPEQVGPVSKTLGLLSPRIRTTLFQPGVPHS